MRKIAIIVAVILIFSLLTPIPIFLWDMFVDPNFLEASHD